MTRSMTYKAEQDAKCREWAEQFRSRNAEIIKKHEELKEEKKNLIALITIKEGLHRYLLNWKRKCDMD